MYDGAGDNRTGDTKLIYLDEKSKLKDTIENIKKSGDTFLVKASHAMGFEEVVSQL